MNSDQELPSEIIYDILSRTSFETLDRCKVVSKGWKQMIYESSFLPLFCRRTKSLFGYFVQHIRDNKYVSTFVSIDQSEEGKGGCSISQTWPRDDVRILASCNQGLLCCDRQKCRNHRYYVSKPATQQWQALPNPKLRYKTVGVMIIVLKSKPLHYKIVRLSERNTNEELMMEYVCEIFDSKTWAWRETNGVSLPYDELIVFHNPAISVGGFVYWLTYKDNVLAFDVAHECFRIFCLPEAVYKNDDAYKDKRLVEYEGGLGFTCLTEDGNMELWLIESSRNYRWMKTKVVDMSILGEIVGHPWPVGFCNSDIVFMKSFYEAVLYRLQDCSFTTMEVDFDFRFAWEIFQFRSDLEYVDLRSGR